MGVISNDLAVQEPRFAAHTAVALYDSRALRNRGRLLGQQPSRGRNNAVMALRVVVAVHAGEASVGEGLWPGGVDAKGA